MAKDQDIVVGTDPLQEQHEEYIKQCTENGIPLWMLEYYWYV